MSVFDKDLIERSLPPMEVARVMFEENVKSHILYEADKFNRMLEDGSWENKEEIQFFDRTSQDLVTYLFFKDVCNLFAEWRRCQWNGLYGYGVDPHKTQITNASLNGQPAKQIKLHINYQFIFEEPESTSKIFKRTRYIQKLYEGIMDVEVLLYKNPLISHTHSSTHFFIY